MQCRSFFPRQHCIAFHGSDETRSPGIGPVFVINLDRQPHRWRDMLRELSSVVDASGEPLSDRVVRRSARDAQVDPSEFPDSPDVDPYYTLSDQLFVEPQPLAIPDDFDLHRPIRMSQAEVAVACSHIETWRAIARSDSPYSLVLEDDVWITRRFGRLLDQAWHEMKSADSSEPLFDILYVSYGEARHGAPKELVSRSVFRPERGLWYLSGYVLSKKGAQTLLDLLPCRGPVDLWINQKFRQLEVRALRRSVINQRRDLHSTNSYSILPALSRIGVLDSGDAALFHRGPTNHPVFAFGAPDAGLSSLAMALSMLGYRCCSDLDHIPEIETDNLLNGRPGRVFDAYVNIGSLVPKIQLLSERYPNATFVLIESPGNSEVGKTYRKVAALNGADVLRLHPAQAKSWRALCEHLKLAPPDANYPDVRDVGMRKLLDVLPSPKESPATRRLRHDPSPWVANMSKGWMGLSVTSLEVEQPSALSRNFLDDDFSKFPSVGWHLRSDTFPGNLALFRPSNVTTTTDGISLSVAEQPLGVRNLSAAAISSQDRFLYGRFEVTLQATSTPGLVTGFFLHRNSPRQEIDVEILGSRPRQLLANVYYNPGTEGAKFDYGYRGTPTVIDLGFDASQAFHRFAIEWGPHEIRWLVDDNLVHRRSLWCPTPIPDLPMTLHVNNWPPRSRELAGRLARWALPSSALVRQVVIDACNAGTTFRAELSNEVADT
jgi:GR25 family glycosyltransferase involved in LPS biosynthesis